MFFITAKLLWIFLSPLNLLSILGGMGLALWRVAPKIGSIFCKTALWGLIVFAVFPLGPLALHALETRYPWVSAQNYPKGSVDGILLLGGMQDTIHINGQNLVSSTPQIDRLFCFLEAAQAHPKARLVFSGGAGNPVRPEDNESESFQKSLPLLRIAPERITFENRSRNTYENVLYSKEILKPSSQERWVVITSAYHLPRTMGIFSAQGWDVGYISCDPKTESPYEFFASFPSALKNFSALDIVMKEGIGSLAYWITGKSSFLFPPHGVGSAHAQKTTSP